MVWDVFLGISRVWGSHRPREDIPPLTPDQSEKLIVFRKRILSRIQNLTSEVQRQVIVRGTFRSFSRMGHSTAESDKRRIAGLVQTNPGYRRCQLKRRKTMPYVE
ncbi:hypothetical protein TNCV_2609131 [Trichonephila clavipes]|nr:hypothetical protein TNCV_2609131 [Trichonephila clavipes]